MMNHKGASQALHFIRCVIADETYCLSISRVCSLQSVEQLQGQHETSDAVGWLASDQGQIPVFHLATLLQRSRHTDRQTGQILVLDTQPHPLGLLVDRVERAIEVTASEVFPLPTIARNPAADFFEGVVRHADTMMLVLSPEGLHPNAPAEGVRPLPTEHTLEDLYTVVGGSTVGDTTGKVLMFSTSPDWAITFGLSLSQVPQILLPLPILPVPGAAAYILGLVAWQGVPLAVIDLSSRLGGAASPVAHDGRLLIVRSSTTRAFVGMPIQPHISLHHLPMAHRVSDLPVPLQESLIRGRFDLEHTTLVIPDIDRILVPHEDHQA